MHNGRDGWTGEFWDFGMHQVRGGKGRADIQITGKL